MKKLARSFVIGLLCALGAPAAADRLVRHGQDAIPGEYIVVMRGASPSTQSAQANAALGRAIDRVVVTHGVQVVRRYTAALPGFIARMTPEQADALAVDSDVAFVEENRRVRAGGAIQQTPPWGLDRLDQLALPLDSRYIQLGDGEGVTVYVIDTGLRTTHVDFAGRVLPGAFSINDGREVTDCNGHGTHVAGTIAGATHGVAKRANVVPVRVLGCDGSGTTADVIAGIDWVTANRRPPAVANLSIGGPASDAEDLAVKNLIAAGVTTVVAAGNEAQNACLRSPARVAEAITVGATTQSDARATFSNFGPCIDVSAPGVAIVSAGIAGDAATLQLDGTSMAAPHVAGIAAAYLGANATATPQQIAAAIVGGATPDRIADPNGSPNLLANARVIDTTPPTARIVSPLDGAVVGASFTVRVDAADANLAGVAVAIDDRQIGSRLEAPFELAVDQLPAGSHTVTVTAVDLAGRSTTQSVVITVDEPQEMGELTGGCSAGGGAGLATALVLALALARARWRRLAVLAACSALAACSVGELEEAGPRYIDTDGDGHGDALDTDGDGKPDYSFGTCTTCTPGSVPACLDPLVDMDGDGFPDGLDLDCDGNVDIPLVGGGGGGGNSSRCQTTINDRSIDCSRTNDGVAQCTCRISDQTVSTCTTSYASPCTFGQGANCCGF